MRDKPVTEEEGYLRAAETESDPMPEEGARTSVPELLTHLIFYA